MMFYFLINKLKFNLTYAILKNKKMAEAGKKQIKNTGNELETLFRLVWENSIMGMRLTDSDGIVLMVNNAFCALVGRKKTDIENKPFTVIYLSTKSSDNLRKHKERFNLRSVLPYVEKEFTLWNNEKKWFGVTNSFLDIDNKTKYLLSIFRDITELKKSEDALIESEKRFRLLFENSAESFCIISDKFEECNKKTCELFGCSKEEIIGHTPWEFSPDFQMDGRNSKESALEKINAALNDVPQYFYWQHKRKDNKLIDVEVSLKKFRIRNKDLIQATLHNVTERKRFEKIQNTLYKISEAVHTTSDIQTLYAKIHEVIKSLMSADNFYISLYNESTDLLSFPYFVDEFDSPPEPRKLKKGLTEYVLHTGENMIVTATQDSELRSRGILELIGQASANWLGVALKLEGKTIGVMAVQDYKDESAYGKEEKQLLEFVSEQIAVAIDRKRTAEELKAYTQQLKINKDLLEERAAQLTLLNKKLEESEKKLIEINASKDKLFSIVAHDLKSPFQPLIGMSEILADENNSLTEEERIQFQKGIYNTVKNQYKLLENFLDWSRLQTGKLEFNPIELNLFEIVEGVLKVLTVNAVNKNISVENKINKDAKANADTYMVQSIFQNLISNAIKFTNPGGCVTISEKKIDNSIEVEIEDNGIGMSKDDIKKIFRHDVQHSTMGTSSEKGTGLGLSICKEMITKNGGEIRVTSKLGIGSKFVFTLPQVKQR